jgi:arylsulfatase A-like enzyme
MMRFISAMVLMCSCIPCWSADLIKPKNIVVILADDIGYGDLGCYGSTKIKTPNLDQLARNGMRFTDAHSPASVCTPTRYSLMTGQYPFRHRPGSGILSGVAPLCIPIDRPTLPKMLQTAGYQTAVVGKWHLGLGETETKYQGEISFGPKEVGFDYSFIIPATGDRTPCVYVENGRVFNDDPSDPIVVNYNKKVGDEPTGKENPELLFNQKPSHGHDFTIVNGISRIGWMTGGKKARWKDEEMADQLTSKAISFIEKQQAKPFFLYFASHDAHVPRFPHPRFRGKSEHGLRGDAIVEFDWCVGELVKKLKALKLFEDTLIVVTSDNGGVMDDGYIDGTQNDPSGHRCNGVLRGFKGGLYEGGHRVPFIASWPGTIPANAASSQLICHTDLFATLANLMNQKLGSNAAPDSVDLSNAFLNPKAMNPIRTIHIQQGGNLNALAIRSGDWKLIPSNAKVNAKNPKAVGPQLFNLKEDLEETKNLAGTNPEKVKELTTLLEQQRGTP